MSDVMVQDLTPCFAYRLDIVNRISNLNREVQP